MSSPISSKEKILERLRKGRENRKTNDFPDPDWKMPVLPIPDDLLVVFKTELEAVQGEVVVENSSEKLTARLKELLVDKHIKELFCVDSELEELLSESIQLEKDSAKFLDLEASITKCEQLVARTGSVMVSSAQDSGRRLNVFPSLHVIWAKASQLVPFVEDAIEKVTERYNGDLPSQITAITGPSRTADIEKTLVLGAHGPRELVVLINSSL